MKKLYDVSITHLLVLICPLIATAQWTQVNNGLINWPSTAYSLAATKTTIFAGSSFGMFLSTDTGSNWNAVNDSYLSSTYINSLAIGGMNIYSGTGNDGVYLSTNNGASWTATNNGLIADISALAVSGTNVFAGTVADGLFLSTDTGQTWTAINNGFLFNGTINEIAVSGTNIFAGINNNGGMLLSTDTGARWIAINNGLTDPYIYSLAVIGTYVFAGTDNGGVFLSTDTGASWKAVNNGLPDNDITSLIAYGTDIFAGTVDDGAFLSTDSGASWTPYNNGLTLGISDFAISREYLYAGTYGGGIWRSPLPGINPVASFESSDTVLCINDCIDFNNFSTNATSWQWRFEGAIDSTSTAQNPQNVCYASPGIYSVTLIASNAARSDSVTLSNYITVITSPPHPAIIQGHDTLYCSADSSYTSYQWYFDTTLIAGATDTFLVISNSGNYNVRVSNSNNCYTATGINVVLGLQNYASNNLISVFPNPASSRLVVHSLFSVNWQTVTCSIMNVLGQEPSPLMPLQGRGESVVIDVSGLPAGIYFLQMKSERGSLTKMFVKE